MIIDMHRLAAAAFTLLLCAAEPALAGFQVEQKVAYGGDGQGEATFQWHIGEREFRLDVRRGADVRSFVFNGRVFYVCGKLDKARLDFVKHLNLTDHALVQSLEKGACQELSTNFGLAFLLSPFDAVGHVDAAGGLGASVGASTPETELKGSAGEVKGVKCVDLSRTYKLEDGGSKSNETVSETACNAPTVKWRDGFGRELSMALMRQPGGRASFQAVAADLKKMAGLSLTVSGKSAGRGATGKDFKQTFEVTTTAAHGAAPTPAEVGLPAGYQILDAGNLAMMASHQGQGAKKEVGGARGGDVASVLSALILGVNPAAGLIPP
jgi:hypothetical protein